MSGWRWRNLPERRYEPPTPHQPAGGEPDPAAPDTDPRPTGQPRNRSARFPEPTR